jgi:hypothetical protein
MNDETNRETYEYVLRVRLTCEDINEYVSGDKLGDLLDAHTWDMNDYEGIVVESVSVGGAASNRLTAEDEQDIANNTCDLCGQVTPWLAFEEGGESHTLCDSCEVDTRVSRRAYYSGDINCGNCNILVATPLEPHYENLDPGNTLCYNCATGTSEVQS